MEIYSLWDIVGYSGTAQYEHKLEHIIYFTFIKS